MYIYRMSSITSIIKIRRLAFSASTRHTFNHAHFASLELSLLNPYLYACFSAMFNTNKTLQQKVKASMATSRHFIERYIIIRLSEPHVYSRTDVFTLSGFTTAFKAALNERNRTGPRVSYIIMTGLMHSR